MSSSSSRLNPRNENLPENSGEWPEREFRAIQAMVHDMAGIDLADSKRALVQARLAKRIRALGLKNPAEYVSRLREHNADAERIAMIDALSTNLTRFWREPEHFQHLAQELLPKVVARAAGGDRKIRIWCAGCSTGEEPYGVAMVTARVPGVAEMDFKLLATDISAGVLATAKAGVYSEVRVKNVPAAYREYFQLSEHAGTLRSYRVTDTIRQCISFFRLNLVDPWPMSGPFDAIFCRNVMIYFDRPTQESLVGRYFRLLRPEGVLYVGFSESLTGLNHGFRFLRPATYQKP